jgi:hypothetical protein
MMQEIDLSADFHDLGHTDTNGGIRVLLDGQVMYESAELKKSFGSTSANLSGIGYAMHESKRKRSFHANRLLLNTMVHPLSQDAPIILRPDPRKGVGIAFTSGFCVMASEAITLVRRLIAVGAQFGQDESILGVTVQDVGMLETEWFRFRQWLIELGIPILGYKSLATTRSSSGFIQIAATGKVGDVRNCRLEELRIMGANLYWFGHKEITSAAFEERRVLSWLGGVDGRMQGALQGCITIGEIGLEESIIQSMVTSQNGADVLLPDTSTKEEGFLALVSDADRFPLEDEWRTFGISFHYLGRTNASSTLLLRRGTESRMVSIVEQYKIWRGQG